jgi:hypothetical protein
MTAIFKCPICGTPDPLRITDSLSRCRNCRLSDSASQFKPVIENQGQDEPTDALFRGIAQSMAQTHEAVAADYANVDYKPTRRIAFNGVEISVKDLRNLAAIFGYDLVARAPL